MSTRPAGPRHPEPSYASYASQVDPRNPFANPPQPSYETQPRYYDNEESDLGDNYNRRETYATYGSDASAEGQPYNENGSNYDPYRELYFSLLPRAASRMPRVHCTANNTPFWSFCE